MVMVVADAILEAGRRAGRLNPPKEAFSDQNTERVVHRLQRDSPNLGPDHLGHAVGRDVGPGRYRPQDSQSLGRYLDTALPKEISRVSGHTVSVDQIVDLFKYLTLNRSQLHDGRE